MNAPLPTDIGFFPGDTGDTGDTRINTGLAASPPASETRGHPGTGLQTPIRYSRGKDAFDNRPEQRAAEGFDAFAAQFLADRAQAKGLTYICAPMAEGLNNDQTKFPGVATWRAKHLAQPRAFLPFDFDGIDPPEAFVALREFLARFKGFGYTTASHTPEAPRCRIVLAQSRPTTREEGNVLAAAVQALIEHAVGAGRVTLDPSVYKSEQPLFTPLHTAETFHFDGLPVDVDAVLSGVPPAITRSPQSNAAGREAEIGAADPVFQHMSQFGMVKRDMGNGRFAVECPCGDSHTSDSGESSTVYYLPNFGGVKYGKFHCLHSHCADRPQVEFLAKLGLNPHEVWRQQAGRTKPESYAYAGGRFDVSDDGVFFTGTDIDGNERPPQWICQRLEILAMTRDAKSGEWGRLLEWKDADGVSHRWAMPMELLQTDGSDVRRELSRQGLTIAPGRGARELLSAYLQVRHTDERACCVDRLGWHGDVYVTPAEAIGQRDEIVVFQNTQAIEPALASKGTADEWRAGVAALAAGNPRLVFALSVAFAGPLADIAGEDSGGIHFRGKSSSGKTTALKIAASIWGNPNSYPRLWRATANGLEGLAALHNDGLLILDELSQMDPKEAGEAAYLLANGQGKTRASRTGAARQSARWRLLFLSAGEESLSALMARADKKANAGQEIRLADIDADAGAGMGLFNTLHGHSTPAGFSLAIKDAAAKSYGAVGAQWLRAIVADRLTLAERITDTVRAFVAEAVPAGASGQAERVARRFGLVAAAGELATHYGLTGWPVGEARRAALVCFSSWLESFGGTGNREDRAILAQVRAFFEANGASRFQHWQTAGFLPGDDDARPSDSPDKTVNRAGFWKLTEDGIRQFYVLPEAYRRDVCSGFDPKTATGVLLAAGWLVKGSDGRETHKPRLPGMGPTRCYVFGPELWADG